MFTTRTELKRRIADLERERDALLREREVVDNSGLAKCKGVMCRNCEHAVFLTNLGGVSKLLGCDLTTNCENYKKRLPEAVKA